MANNQLPDASLVQQYVAGNEKALSQLIERHQSRIYGFIYSKMNDRDLCDDIFQDTFIKVIKNLKTKSYNEEGKFLPWVIRIAHNLIVDHYRKNKKMPMTRETETYSIFEFIKDTSSTIEGQMITEQVEVDLQRLIDQLNIIINRTSDIISIINTVATTASVLKIILPIAKADAVSIAKSVPG